MTSNAYMFITGPKVVETVTGEKVTNEQLGGPLVHAQKSGNIHFVANTDEEALDLTRRLLHITKQCLREAHVHRTKR